MRQCACACCHSLCWHLFDLGKGCEQTGASPGVSHTQEVGLAGMLSLLTAVLLHATASGSPASSEPDYTALPHNFCAVAELVLRSALCHTTSLPSKRAMLLL